MDRLKHIAYIILLILIGLHSVQANESMSEQIKRNTQQIYDSSSATLSDTIGDSSNLVLQHANQSTHFSEVKEWLNNLLRANNYGQIRLVLTPGPYECKAIAKNQGMQCTGTGSINIFFAPKKGLNGWGDWVKSPQSLTVKVSGPPYKTLSGAGVGMKEDQMQGNFSTDLIMLEVKPFDYAEGNNRSGPLIPSNHNWLPDSIVSTKSGYTGNAKGFYSLAGMLRIALEDAIGSLNLQSYPYVISWIN